MITNDKAIEILHNLADSFHSNAPRDIYPLSHEECALALDLGASAIKTLDDMGDTMRTLMTLNYEDFDNLTAFLHTQPAYVVLALCEQIKTEKMKNNLNAIYGKNVSRETFYPSMDFHQYTDTDTAKENT